MNQFAQAATQTIADLTQRVGMGELAEQHRHQLRPATEAFGAPFGLVLLDQRSELGARKMLEQLIEQTGCLYDWSALLFRDSGQDRPQQTNRFCSRLIIGGLFLWTASPGTQLKNLFWTRVLLATMLEQDPVKRPPAKKWRSSCKPRPPGKTGRFHPLVGQFQ